MVVMPGQDAPAVLTVDLDALAANFHDVAKLAAPSRVAAVLKANAYGLGVVPVAGRLWREGCTEYFVSSLPEALELRGVLPQATVYVLEGASGVAGQCRQAGVVPVLNTVSEVEEWVREASGAAAVVQIDTGMTRAGLDPQDLEHLVSQGVFQHFHPALLLTHLACADEPAHPMNAAQIDRFARACRALPAIPTSIGNSAGIWLGASFRGDVVRPGIALYGGRPQSTGTSPVSTVVTLTARVLQVRELAQATTVGYGATHELPRGARVATVGLGYADGLPRALGNRGVAYLNGARVPIVGRVSMDLTTLDVTALGPAGCRVGDEAEFLGPHIPLEDVADAALTVGYEVLTRLSARLPRRYLEAGKGVSD